MTLVELPGTGWRISTDTRCNPLFMSYLEYYVNILLAPEVLFCCLKHYNQLPFTPLIIVHAGN